jgi:Na+/proline symporter
MGMIVFSLGLIGTSSALAAWLLSRGMKKEKEWFLVADRKIGTKEGSVCIAASWIWAPALFLSTQKAYEDGLLGFLWFLIPNVVSLLLFAPFAARLRREFPEGITLSAYIGEKYSPRVQALYWLTLGGLAVAAFTMQLLAASQLLALAYGVPTILVTSALGLAPFGYSFFFGLKASTISDLGKMILIFVLGAVLVTWVFIKTNNIEIFTSGLKGRIGTVDILSDESRKIILGFGIPVSIGLVSGPFGDQSFWQRAFAIKTDSVGRSFVYGAILFSVVPIMMSTFGFLAAGLGLSSPRAEFIGLSVIETLLPPMAVFLFLLMVLSGLLSILDSKLTAIASLGGHDFACRIWDSKDLSHARSLFCSRAAMGLFALGGIALANIPGLTILHLFLFYGTLRSATLIPTILTILGIRIPEPGIFTGILLGIIIGLPLFTFGNIARQPALSVAGSLVSLLMPIVIIIFYRLRTNPNLR